MINGATDKIVTMNGTVSEIQTENPFPAFSSYLLYLIFFISSSFSLLSRLTEKRLLVKTVGGESRFIEGHSETRCWVSIKYDR